MGVAGASRKAGVEIDRAPFHHRASGSKGETWSNIRAQEHHRGLREMVLAQVAIEDREPPQLTARHHQGVVRQGAVGVAAGV